MAVDQKAPLELKCKLRERPNPVGRRFTLPNGGAVMGYHLMKVRTDDATPTLMIDLSTLLDYIELADNEFYVIRYDLLAAQVAGSAGTVGDCRVIQGYGAVKRLDGAATVALVDTVYEDKYADTGLNSGVSDALAADTANGGLKMTVTGAVNKTIDWELAIYVEIGLPVD
jgi:hypothetical protein